MASELVAITTYYNPASYRRRLPNYRAFRQALKVPLVTVELGFGGPFELTGDDADILVRLPAGSILWQKERLLNVALRHVPEGVDSVAWIDCDLIFEREDWPAATVQMLERHPLVQLFDQACFPGRDVLPGVGSDRSAIRSVASFAHKMSSGSMNENGFVNPWYQDELGRCRFGFAWAARRSLLDARGFYDAFILGSGDRAMATAAYGRFDETIQACRLNARRADHYRDWAVPFFQKVRGNVGCLTGRVYHLWHGEIADRRYRERHIDFMPFDFDPFSDIKINAGGAYVWASDKPAVHAYVERYFHERNEDGTGNARPDLPGAPSSKEAPSDL